MSSSGLSKAVQLLGISKAQLQAIRAARTRLVAAARLQKLKRTVRSNYRKAALELHPDRTGNDPTTTDLFRVMTELHDRIQNTEIAEPPPSEDFVCIPMGPVAWVVSVDSIFED